MIPKEVGAITVIGDSGKEYSALYHVDRTLITVTCEYGAEKGITTPGSDPKPMARIMLAKIIRKKVKK